MVTVDSSVLSGTIISNVGYASASNLANTIASSAVTSTVVGPDLVISKSVSTATISINDLLTYTLVVKNNGPAIATTVTLTDIVPTDTRFQSASNGGSEAAGVVSWNLGSLNVGEVLTRTMIVTVNTGVAEGTNLINTGYAIASNIAGLQNSNSVVTVVAAPVLTLTIHAEPTPIEPTTTFITYTIRITNSGSAAATNVGLTNTIPSSTIFISASDGGSETSLGSGVITWPVVTIDASTTIVRTFHVSVTQTIEDGNDLVNIISINSDEGFIIDRSRQPETVEDPTEPVYLPIILQSLSDLTVVGD
ncbi:MAG: DUF11 domain-containing protein [Chloroflexota bacterium]